MMGLVQAPAGSRHTPKGEGPEKRLGWDGWLPSSHSRGTGQPWNNFVPLGDETLSVMEAQHRRGFDLGAPRRWGQRGGKPAGVSRNPQM